VANHVPKRAKGINHRTKQVRMKGLRSYSHTRGGNGVKREGALWGRPHQRIFVGANHPGTTTQKKKKKISDCEGGKMRREQYRTSDLITKLESLK